MYITKSQKKFEIFFSRVLMSFLLNSVFSKEMGGPEKGRFFDFVALKRAVLIDFECQIFHSFLLDLRDVVRHLFL